MDKSDSNAKKLKRDVRAIQWMLVTIIVLQIMTLAAMGRS